MNDICPYAKNLNHFPFFLCDILMKRIGFVPKNPIDAAKCFCKHQEYCYLTGNPKNTEKARRCEVRP